MVSLVAYGIWAFGPKMGAPLLYPLIALAYVGLSGVLMSGLLEGPRPVFAVVFDFCSGFSSVRGRVVCRVVRIGWACWGGFWIGCGSVVSRAGDRKRCRSEGGVFSRCGAVLFLFHTLGYYLGDMLYTGGQGHEWLSPIMDSVSGKTRVSIARLLWGLGHGAGFGAGLGYAFWKSQRSAA